VKILKIFAVFSLGVSTRFTVESLVNVAKVNDGEELLLSRGEENSIIFNSKYAGVDYRSFSIDMENVKKSSITTNTERLRKLKLFPIFNDEKIGRICPSYFLYLEFFHGIIRMLAAIFIVCFWPAFLYIFFYLGLNPFYEYRTTSEIRFVYIVVGLLGNLFVSWLRKREENMLKVKDKHETKGKRVEKKK